MAEICRDISALPDWARYGAKAFGQWELERELGERFKPYRGYAQNPYYK